MVILVLVGIVVVVIVAIAGFTVPARHAEAVANEFSWQRTIRIAARVWVEKKSKRKPPGEVRNVEVHNAEDADNRYYTYEKREWRNERRVKRTGRTQADVQWPPYELGMDEQVRSRREWYKATFASEEGKRYTAKVRFLRWTALEKGVKYRLGRSAFGSVRAGRAGGRGWPGRAGSGGRAGRRPQAGLAAWRGRPRGPRPRR